MQPSTPRKGENPVASAVGDLIEPWLVGGGRTFWQTSRIEGPILEPQLDGVQLVSAYYVPRGRIGFIKRLSIAPTVPSVIGDGFRNGLSWLYTQPQVNRFPGGSSRANSANGLWETPMAWEGFFNSTLTPPPDMPSWQWSIRYLKGNWYDIRNNLTKGRAFDPLDPTTWILALDIPVNPVTGVVSIAELMQGAVATPGYLEPQRFPILPRDGFTTHWPVPGNTSVLLYARWTQPAVTVFSATSGGSNELEEDVYVIGPSVGQMHGYTQPDTSDAALENVAHGWGG